MTDPRRQVEKILKQSEHPWPNSLVCTKAFNELGQIATAALDREAEARGILEIVGALRKLPSQSGMVDACTLCNKVPGICAEMGCVGHYARAWLESEAQDEGRD